MRRYCGDAVPARLPELLLVVWLLLLEYVAVVVMLPLLSAPPCCALAVALALSLVAASAARRTRVISLSSCTVSPCPTAVPIATDPGCEEEELWDGLWGTGLEGEEPAEPPPPPKPKPPPRELCGFEFLRTPDAGALGELLLEEPLEE